MRSRRSQGWSWQSRGAVIPWVLPLIIGLSGCAGTPWGETLSGSFPSPQEEQEPRTSEPAREPEPAPSGTPRTPAAVTSPAQQPPGQATRQLPASSPAPESKPGTSLPAGGSRPQAPQQSPPAGKTQLPKVRAVAQPTSPTPYRVTIRLPQADPSAPAEGVTEALRAAGIPFEVETIERVKGGGPQGPEGTPTSTVRPAPPAR
jgi:hypothetical protein